MLNVKIAIKFSINVLFGRHYLNIEHYGTEDICLDILKAVKKSFHFKNNSYFRFKGETSKQTTVHMVTPGHNIKLFVKLFYNDCRFKILKISKSFLENLPGHSWSHLVTCAKNLNYL